MSKLNVLNQKEKSQTAPMSFPGYFSYTMCKYNAQAREWYATREHINENVDLSKFEFRQGIVYQYHNMAKDEVMYLFKDYKRGWRTLTASEVAKLNVYFAKQAQQKVQSWRSQHVAKASLKIDGEPEIPAQAY